MNIRGHHWLLVGICSASLLSAAMSNQPDAGSESRVSPSQEQWFTVSPGTSLFLPNGTLPSALSPSIAFADPRILQSATSAAGVPGIKPIFSSDAEGNYSIKVDLPAGAIGSTQVAGTTAGWSLYGLGGVPGTFERTGQTVRASSDINGAPVFPWVMAIGPDGSGFGLLAALPPSQHCEVRCGSGAVEFASIQGPFGVVVIEGSTPEQIIIRLSMLLGTPKLPPQWALGWLYGDSTIATADAASKAAQGLRTASIPCDAIWFGNAATDASSGMGFDATAVSDPKGLLADLKGKGFSAIWSGSPAFVDVPGRWVRDQLVNSKLAISDAAGEPSHVNVSGVATVAPDFSRDETRNWWAGIQRELALVGVDGVVIDDRTSGFLRADTRLKGGTYAGADLASGSGDAYRGTFGTLIAESTAGGLEKSRPGLRPMVIAREESIGLQRAAIAAVRSGGTDGVVAQALSLGLSGQPLQIATNAPLKSSADHDAIARDIAVTSLLALASGSGEPWALGNEAQRTVKQAIERRYRLLPYIYSAVNEATETGLPVVRPVFFADPRNPALRSESRAFLLGADLLVVPKARAGEAPIVIAIPGVASDAPVGPGTWQKINLVSEGENDSLPDLFVRPGAIIPIGPVRQSTKQEYGGPLTLLVNLGEGEQAAGELYEDLGDGYEYTTGRWLRTAYTATFAEGRLKLEIPAREGSFARPARDLLVAFLRNGEVSVAKGVDGMSLNFDPVRRKPTPMGRLGTAPGAEALPPKTKI